MDKPGPSEEGGGGECWSGIPFLADEPSAEVLQKAQSMSSSHVALVALLLQELALADYKKTGGTQSASIAAAWALQVQSMSSSHVALVPLPLREWVLAGYKATGPPPGNE